MYFMYFASMHTKKKIKCCFSGVASGLFAYFPFQNEMKTFIKKNIERFGKNVLGSMNFNFSK